MMIVISSILWNAFTLFSYANTDQVDDLDAKSLQITNSLWLDNHLTETSIEDVFCSENTSSIVSKNTIIRCYQENLVMHQAALFGVLLGGGYGVVSKASGFFRLRISGRLLGAFISAGGIMGYIFTKSKTITHNIESVFLSESHHNDAITSQETASSLEEVSMDSAHFSKDHKLLGLDIYKEDSEEKDDFSFQNFPGLSNLSVVENMSFEQAIEKYKQAFFEKYNVHLYFSEEVLSYIFETIKQSRQSLPVFLEEALEAYYFHFREGVWNLPGDQEKKNFTVFIDLNYINESFGAKAARSLAALKKVVEKKKQKNTKALENNYFKMIKDLEYTPIVVSESDRKSLINFLNDNTFASIIGLDIIDKEYQNKYEKLIDLYNQKNTVFGLLYSQYFSDKTQISRSKISDFLADIYSYTLSKEGSSSKNWDEFLKFLSQTKADKKLFDEEYFETHEMLSQVIKEWIDIYNSYMN